MGPTLPSDALMLAPRLSRWEVLPPENVAPPGKEGGVWGEGEGLGQEPPFWEWGTHIRRSWGLWTHPHVAGRMESKGQDQAKKAQG